MNDAKNFMLRIRLLLNGLFENFVVNNSITNNYRNSFMDLRNNIYNSLFAIFHEPDIYKKYTTLIDNVSLQILQHQTMQENDSEIIFPKIPFDNVETNIINNTDWNNKYDEFINKFSSLKKEIKKLFKNAVPENYYHISYYEFESVILKIFLFEFENRPFQQEDFSGLFIDTKKYGPIINRNIPCEICSENRVINSCHIIPRSLGGRLDDDNILYLCPTHHSLFDRFMLSETEWEKINWNKHSYYVKEFAMIVIKKQHEVFWNNLKNTNYSAQTPESVDYRPYKKYIKDLILEKIKDSTNELDINQIKTNFDSSLHKLVDDMLLELWKDKMINIKKSKILKL